MRKEDVFEMNFGNLFFISGQISGQRRFWAVFDLLIILVFGDFCRGVFRALTLI